HPRSNRGGNAHHWIGLKWWPGILSVGDQARRRLITLVSRDVRQHTEWPIQFSLPAPATGLLLRRRCRHWLLPAQAEFPAPLHPNPASPPCGSPRSAVACARSCVPRNWAYPSPWRRTQRDEEPAKMRRAIERWIQNPSLDRSFCTKTCAYHG